MGHTHESVFISSLTFPRDIFATLSPSSFIKTHINQSSSFDSGKEIRPNGRQLHECRLPHINTGSLSHASGSAVVRLGDTAAVAGIRPEIIRVQDIPNVPKSVKEWQPLQYDGKRRLNNEDKIIESERHDQGQILQEDEVSALGLVVPNVDTNTACASQHSNASSRLAQDLTQRILELIQFVGLVKADDLRLTYKPSLLESTDAENVGPEDVDKGDCEQVVAYWVLYIDIVFISLDGAAFDTAWCAAVAALQNLALPRATWQAELNNVVCDIEKSKSRRLNLRGLPFAASFVASSGANRNFGEDRSVAVHENGNPGRQVFVLADPDSFEERVCNEAITIVVDCSGENAKILRLEKRGGTFVGRNNMKKLIELAGDRWSQLNQAVASSII